VTGRVTDAAVVCGPAAWHHGWARDDWTRSPAGRAGHVIECGAAGDGGNYSFFTEVAGMTHVGSPGRKVAGDGSCVIGKHDGTGGEVSVGTVTSQLLYEIGGPEYYGPDVTARFDTIALEQVGPTGPYQRHQGRAAARHLEGRHERGRGLQKDMGVALTGLESRPRRSWWRKPSGRRARTGR